MSLHRRLCDGTPLLTYSKSSHLPSLLSFLILSCPLRDIASESFLIIHNISILSPRFRDCGMLKRSLVYRRTTKSYPDFIDIFCFIRSLTQEIMRPRSCYSRRLNISVDRYPWCDNSEASRKYITETPSGVIASKLDKSLREASRRHTKRELAMCFQRVTMRWARQGSSIYSGCISCSIPLYL